MQAHQQPLWLRRGQPDKDRQDFMPSRQQQPADQAARHGDKGDSSDRLTLARLEKATATIQSPELRAALIRLGQSLS